MKQGRADYLLPTVVHCDSPDAAAAKKEYMFPFVTVVQCPEAKMLEAIGPTLVCTALTNNPALRRKLIDAVHVDRLNLGPVPTTQLNWLQPHEGNLIDFLFRARAFQTADDLRMDILSITAGAAGMYCGCCSRDNALAVELLARGHEVTLLPLYTPTNPDEANVSRKRVLFGGISIYLQQYIAVLPQDAALPRSAVGLAVGHQRVREPIAVDRSEPAGRHDDLDARGGQAASCARSSTSCSSGSPTSRCPTSSTCRTRCSSALAGPLRAR